MDRPDRRIRQGTRRRARVERPATSFDAGLQHERTALAWERTAIATMVAGTLLGRWGAVDDVAVFAVLGILQVAFGAGLLAWSAAHYDDLHGPLRAGLTPTNPRAAWVVGVATTVGIGAAFVLASVVVVRGV